ncbi:MAG: flagellar hook-length control protein FliK [Plesiomonas sp.]|uniref:flagellar hook-length control protein FliK n=1 Tax=Plesiomonas sp. TaxID=2486279 RepID=UPI003EE5F5A7
MTLNAIPTASPSVPTQRSASSNNIKPQSAGSTLPESGRNFSECLNQSDASSVKPSSTSNKPAAEKDSNKKSANSDADSGQQVSPSSAAVSSPENTIKTDSSGNQFSTETNVADDEAQTDDAQEIEGSSAVNSGAEVSETGEGSALSGGMINAQDDPWLQQLDASRKALQSPIASASTDGDADTVNSTEKAGATGLAAQALTANRHVQGAVEGAQAAEEGSADQLSIDDLSTHKDRAADAHSAKMALRAESSSKLHSEMDLARQSALLFTEDSQQKSSDQSTHSADRLSRLSALSSMGNEAPVVTPPAQGHDLLAALRQQNAVSARQAEHVQTPNTPLPLRNPEQSAQVLHEQVQFLLNRKLDTVEIRLDPPELGNLQIKLQLNQDQAQVGIIVHNTQARELLEQTLPRLREMLAQQGIMLGQTQIQQQGQAHDQQARGGQAGSGEQATQTQVLHTTGDIETELLPQKAVSISPYQVDYYA